MEQMKHKADADSQQQQIRNSEELNQLQFQHKQPLNNQNRVREKKILSSSLKALGFKILKKILVNPESFTKCSLQITSAYIKSYGQVVINRETETRVV
ncbi:hypothetical protein CK203_053638 [Vitis vinifera]|uniref:Uncharacterized protein n=1 Tax=Vitis vinifera TaxID=29760 RepID=A0A438GJQ2_VITVI|nr:hypothetical protein CK203_053638 [Vitis vinifera]